MLKAQRQRPFYALDSKQYGNWLYEFISNSDTFTYGATCLRAARGQQ